MMAKNNLKKLITQLPTKNYLTQSFFFRHNYSLKPLFFHNFVTLPKKGFVPLNKTSRANELPSHYGNSYRHKLLHNEIFNNKNNIKTENNICISILKKLDQDIESNMNKNCKLSSVAQEIIALDQWIKVLKNVHTCFNQLQYTVSAPSQTRHLRSIYFLWISATTSIKINQYKLSDKQKNALKTIDNLLDNAHKIAGFTYYSPIEELVK